MSRLERLTTAPAENMARICILWTLHINHLNFFFIISLHNFEAIRLYPIKIPSYLYQYLLAMNLISYWRVLTCMKSKWNLRINQNLDELTSINLIPRGFKISKTESNHYNSKNDSEVFREIPHTNFSLAKKLWRMKQVHFIRNLLWAMC